MGPVLIPLAIQPTFERANGLERQPIFACIIRNTLNAVTSTYHLLDLVGLAPVWDAQGFPLMCAL